MATIDELLTGNQAHAETDLEELGAEPSRKVAVVTCMDTRIEPLAVLGLARGQAHIIRNAGGRVTEDVLRSLALSTHKLGVDTVVVMEHTRCGLSGSTDEELRRDIGADLEFRAIGDHEAALRADVELLTSTPYLDRIRAVAAFLYDVDSGAVTEIERRER